MRPISLLSVLLLTAPCFAQSKPLVVHEWGTFTSLQDETGRSIGYLNSSVEPLPNFVHRLRGGLLLNDPINIFAKNESGFGTAHPDVTMRLETPVIYFHPADKNADPFTVDVTATLKGGVLSEYYPSAKFHIAGGSPAPAGLDSFTDQLAGSLTWKSLRVGGDVKIPETPEQVWLAPRQVDSAPVAMGSEGERYVFYRGVGKIDSPVKTTRSSGVLLVQPQGLIAWLAEFKPDGTCAFHSFKGDCVVASFAGDEFSRQRTADLRAEMRKELIVAGLFEDEADAMLNTWERSYFQGVGQRLFFVVPREWADQVLPLTISTPCELTRVMIGRIELVTPEQRKVIAHLPEQPAEMSKLGRFGYALVLDELQRSPTKALAEFAAKQGIRQSQPTTRPAPAAAPAAVLVTPPPAIPNSDRVSR